MAQGVSANEEWTWAVSVFRFPTDFFGGQIGDNGGYGMASRLTHLLVDQDGVQLHLGAAYSLIDPANDAVQYRNQPELFVAETGGAAFVPAGVPDSVPSYVDTGVIPTKFAHLFAAEIAFTSGQFHAQSEYVHALVEQLAGNHLSFQGLSAQVAWILTGEHRPYNKKSGTLGRIVPTYSLGSEGTGAWEVAARYSFLNLDDNNIQGGELQNLTLGLNWYLNRNTKFQFNYIHAMLDRAGIGNSDADLFGIRAQLDF